MAWNEPGGNKNDQDPWGTGGRRGGDQGPPDLDEALKRGLEKLNRLFGGRGGGGQGGSSGGSSGLGPILAIVAVIAVIFLVFQSVYTVDEQERAVVLRFGKYHDTMAPGLQFKLPLVDDVRKVSVTNVRSFDSNAEMLTEDQNIVDVALAVQYQVGDARSFILNVRDPIETLRYASDSALRHEVGGANLNQVLTTGRAELAKNVEVRLQQFLESYGTGLRVVKVNVEDSQPPKAVQSAFDEVQRAREDEQRVIEQAETYRNKVVPEARGAAQRILEEARAYKQQVTEKAKGDVERFLAVLEVYEQAPEVTRERMYIETLENVLSRTSKVMVDVKGGNNMMYLPLDRLTRNIGQSASSSSSDTQASTPSPVNIQKLADEVVNELRNRQSDYNGRRGR
ncbi:FtsH protease activity modulator HflK [Marinobacteraceae bacterium S3BR75-40.1]